MGIGISGIGATADFPYYVPGNDEGGGGGDSGGAVASMIGAATAGYGAAVSTGSNIIGGVVGGMMAVAPYTGPAAPFIIGAASLIAPIFNLFKGCGDTCIQATEIANQAQDAIVQLNEMYWGQPVRYKSAQKAALVAFDNIAGRLYRLCSNPQLQQAGQRCIAERLVPGGTAPWCPNPRHVGCDWVTMWRNPIANDSGVVPDLVPTNTQTQTGTGGGTNSTGTSISSSGLPIPLLLGGGALLLLALMSS